MKKLLVCLLACLMTVGFASCTRDDRPIVGSIIFEATNEWFVEATAGMEDAAKENNVNLLKSDSRYDLGVERELIQENIKKKAGAIVICPLSVKESGATLSEAAKLGIPVVTWNSVVEPKPTSQIVVDQNILGSATGKYLAEYIRKNNPGPLKAALLIDNAFSIGIERCEGFRKSIQPLIDSGAIEVVAEAKGNLHEETVITMEKLLNEHPEINIVWCWNQMSTMAAADVLKRHNRRDVIITGTDMSLALAEDMLKDEINLVAITTQQPYQLGYQAVQMAVKAMRGESVETSLTIPTMTYTKEKTDEIKEYISSHKKFVKQK